MTGRLVRAIVLLAACSACYRLTPIQGVASDAGKPVRVQLTEQGSIDLTPLIGASILTLDGTIVAVRDSLLGLSVTNAIARNGVENPWKGERVDVPRRAIVSVQVRELDKRRSWLAAAGGVAATAAVGAAWNIFGGAFGGKIPPTGGGPR